MLKCWPIVGPDLDESFRDYLRTRLSFDDQFIDEKLGDVQFTRFRNLRSKVKKEYIVTFECKEIRR